MRVGFVGLGAMGSGIVRRLLSAGRDVTGWNRTRAKAEPLLAAGMGWADTPREVAAGADVVFTMLTDVKGVRAALLGDDGILAGLASGAVLVDMSTIAPDESRALAAQVAEAGATMLDAPVSGSTATLEQGQLSVMVGGPREAFERVEPLLRDMGPKVTHVGDNGHALVVKLAINLSLVVQVMSFCESVALAEKAGIAREAAVDAVLKSVIASPVLGYRGPFVLEQPETPWSDVALQQKDQLLGLGLARSLGAAVPFAALANELLTATRAAGLGDRDFAAAYEVFRAMGGIE
ncbi:MAG TPA: NAD(P)-dependent oxidoreductase [Gaiellaceae bacterium]|nr:NAD(P)-dependent oxidoreductase [Gaiellaceae bacterium]